MNGNVEIVRPLMIVLLAVMVGVVGAVVVLLGADKAAPYITFVSAIAVPITGYLIVAQNQQIHEIAKDNAEKIIDLQSMHKGKDGEDTKP